MNYKLIYEIELPTTNKIVDANRRNRFAGGQQKKKYTDIITILTRKQLKKKITKKVDLHCYWYCKDRRTDKDNVTGGLKFVLDGLQDAGVIKNDGWSEIGDIHHYFCIDKKKPRLELHLKEREDKE